MCGLSLTSKAKKPKRPKKRPKPASLAEKLFQERALTWPLKPYADGFAEYGPVELWNYDEDDPALSS